MTDGAVTKRAMKSLLKRANNRIVGIDDESIINKMQEGMAYTMSQKEKDINTLDAMESAILNMKPSREKHDKVFYLLLCSLPFPRVASISVTFVTCLIKRY